MKKKYNKNHLIEAIHTERPIGESLCEKLTKSNFLMGKKKIFNLSNPLQPDSTCAKTGKKADPRKGFLGIFSGIRTPSFTGYSFLGKGKIKTDRNGFAWGEKEDYQ